MSTRKATDFIQLNSKVFYPSHGAGQVIRERDIEFAGETQKYFDFEFFNKNLTISTPVHNIEKLGIRHVLPIDEITKKIKVLAKQLVVNPEVTDYNELMIKIEKLDLEGEVDSFIKMIQYCNHEKDKRVEEGRLIPVSITKHIRNSITHIVNEMALSGGLKFSEASEQFTKLTALEVR